MLKNLDVDRYRNGEPIRHVESADDWLDAYNNQEGAWCYYDNDNAKGEIYGKLYNWYAVNDPRGLAPSGFHIPSDSAWNILINYLGGTEIAGGKLKVTGTELWNSPNAGATNSSGFSALPSGYRQVNGIFNGTKYYSYWWSATESNQVYAWHSITLYNNAGIYFIKDFKGSGFSVRCVKD